MIKIEYTCDNCGRCEPYMPSKAGGCIICYKCNHEESIPKPAPINNKPNKEKQFLEDTRDILTGYDGYQTEKQLKGLIDETRERLTAILNGKIQEYEDSI